MADKNLRIGVKSDLRDGQKLTRFITELHQKVEKFSRVLGNLTLGGGARGPGGEQKPGQPTLAKQLEGDKKAMEAMGREVDNLNRRFQNLGNTIASAGNKIQQATGGGLVDQYGRPISSGGGGGGGGPPGGPPGPGGPGSGGGGPPGPGGRGGGSIWNRPVGGPLGFMGRMVGWGTILNNLQEGFFNAPTRAIQWAGLGAQAQAGGNAAMGGFGAQILGGNLAPSLGLMRASGLGHGQTGFSRDDLQDIINASPEEAERLALRKGVSLNFVKGINEAAQGLDPRSKAAAINQRMAEMVQTGMQQDPMQDARIAYAMQQAPSRTAFARRFGKDFSAGTALGQNVDPAQVMATVAAVLDVMGTGTNIAKVTKVVTAATKAGISGEAIQAMMRAEGLGGGRLLDIMMHSGLSRPMMGRAGTAAAGFAGQSLMALGDVGARGFAGAGAGTNELSMRRMEAGVGLLGQVTTGGLDPFQATINAAAATKAGRSVFVSQTLMAMTPQELLKAATQGPTKEQELAGITKESARSQFNTVIHSLKFRAFSERGITEGSKGIQALTGLPEDVVGFLQGASQEQRMAVGVGISQVTGQPLGVGGGMMDFLAGEFGPERRGGSPKTTTGRFGTALSAGFAGAREQEKGGAEFVLAMRDLQAAVSTAAPAVKMFSDAMKATNVFQATQAGAALNGLGVAMGDIAKKGPDAIKVMDKVKEFIDAIASKKAAIEAAKREQVDFYGSSQAP